VLSVTADGHLQADGARYDPSADAGSMDATTTSLGVQGWWKAGTRGAGVDVALIDSGVSPVQGLRGLSKKWRARRKCSSLAPRSHPRMA
jgi:hypothetical protein